MKIESIKLQHNVLVGGDQMAFFATRHGFEITFDESKSYVTISKKGNSSIVPLSTIIYMAPAKEEPKEEKKK